MPTQIPHLHVSGCGNPIHFYHANGFPAEVYMPFLTQLAKNFDVYAMNGRATWDDIGEPNHKNWHVFADDLIQYLEATQTEPIIAIGHSMGASSTVLAAVKRPDLFKALVLIEPAMVNWPLKLIMNLLPRKTIQNMKLIKGTANKPHLWPNKEAYKTYLKKFHGYKLLNEEAFNAFMNHGVKATADEQVTLRFPKQWEAHNYTTPPYLMGQLKKLEHKKIQIPTVAIRGKTNNFFPEKLWDIWKTNQPNAVFLENHEYGHLMPLESAETTIELIQSGLEALHLTTR